MGTVIDLECSRCDRVRTLYVGCGFGGCNHHWYCPECGRIHEAFQSIESMQAGDPQPAAPTCPKHPGRRMRELDLEASDPNASTTLRCMRCRRGLLTMIDAGLWD